MGYYIFLNKVKFVIKKQNQVPAFKAAKMALMHGLKTGKGSGYVSGRSAYAWIRTNELENSGSLDELLEIFRYRPVFEDSDIVSLEFEGEKIGDEMELWNLLAPFVEDGSYIEVNGEDGAIWRWSFDGRDVKEIWSTITWK